MQKSVKVRTQEANRELREALDVVLEKEDHRLTKTDREFLKARRMYLTSAEINRYPSVFEDGAEPEDGDEVDTRFPGKSYKQIQEMAANLGMVKVVGVKRDILEAYILEQETKE